MRAVKKLFYGIVIIALLLVASACVLAHLLTSEIEIAFTQDPNKVEAHEANRKLQLFSEAREAKRRGFIRLSEVEINSFLDGRSFGTTNKAHGNSGNSP